LTAKALEATARPTAPNENAGSRWWWQSLSVAVRKVTWANVLRGKVGGDHPHLSPRQEKVLRHPRPSSRSPRGVVIYACVYSGALMCARTSRTSWSVCVAATTSAEGERSAPLP
jgi:hypothetical protein